MTPQQAAHLTQLAQSPSMTAAPLLTGWAHQVYEEAHSLAAEVVCDLAERSMRAHGQKRHRGNRAAGLLSSLLVLTGLAYMAGRKAGAR